MVRRQIFSTGRLSLGCDGTTGMSGIFRYACGFLFLLLHGVMSPVYGKDVKVLSRVLYASFVAEQGSAMCMVPSINLSESDRVIFINAKNYAQRIKQKVSNGLSDDDVQYVLKSAADRAREEMREVVRVLKSNPPDKESLELFRWCTTSMKPVADEVVRTYVDHPDVIDKLIEGAKHD